MRTDLPSMNAGKAMAQASHASNAFIKYHGSKNSVKEWEKQTHQGFGTVLILAATLDKIDKIFSGAYPHIKAMDIITDPTYPYIVNSEIKNLIDMTRHTGEIKKLESGDFLCFRSEITCAYLFGEKEDIEQYVSHLKLHP